MLFLTLAADSGKHTFEQFMNLFHVGYHAWVTSHLPAG
jgi:hypothetical protein